MGIISIIQDRVIDGFINYLKSSGLSKNSIRFYKSDLSHFSGWIVDKNKKLGVSAETFMDTVPFLKVGVAHEYKTHLIDCKIPPKTINRKLSTLRRFSDYLVSSGIISFDLAQGLENIPGLVVSNISRETDQFMSLVADFQKHLESQKASKNTIKNYVADVKHFFTWIEINHA